MKEKYNNKFKKLKEKQKQAEKRLAQLRKEQQKNQEVPNPHPSKQERAKIDDFDKLIGCGG